MRETNRRSSTSLELGVSRYAVGFYSVNTEYLFSLESFGKDSTRVEGVAVENGGAEGGEGVEADRMIDSDYKMGECNNDERTIEPETGENGSREGEIDVVDNEGDLDEIRDPELGDEDGPVYPVFNL
ncbi:hypothetical protein Salat_1540500 [Sesamum alatum]|uniref:Uncharacterized protein n=1 Tax=Sesamum alatum TaxID=300844 RepID=A0AAE2CML7_9LAMI|nr:hypothetical protein Salat_1540500 [Sesamum alatum]